MFGRAALLVAVMVLVDPLRAAASSSCLSITEAGKHIGATRCVVGKVIRVKQGNRGVHFFDFCEDYRTCPFMVVVFSGDLKQIGDVRQLVGRQIEIDGDQKLRRPSRNRAPSFGPIAGRRGPHSGVAERL